MQAPMGKEYRVKYEFDRGAYIGRLDACHIHGALPEIR